MDLLTGYGSDSGSADEDQPDAANSPHSPPTTSAGPVLRLPRPDDKKKITLFNPFVAEQPAHVAARVDIGSITSSTKRSYTSVSGHSLPAAGSKSKATKEHVTAAPNAATKGTASFLPPQLSGRSNVVTEDVEKLGLKARKTGTARHGLPAGQNSK
eukprot:gene2469-2772_t